jgi:peptide/nickel transport system substrate-binding protein
MVDGVGVYGDTLRHVIGGRPEGWNYGAGQTQGWGGIDIGLSECLTRTAPLFQVQAKDTEPLPNLAKSWDWSEGRPQADHASGRRREVVGWRALRRRRHHVLLGRRSRRSERLAARRRRVAGSLWRWHDAEEDRRLHVEWTFKDAFPKQYLYTMAYPNFCPGPSHILKPQHPKYSKNTYDQFKNAFPPEYMNMPVMGAWVPVEYRADDIIVMRRNPLLLEGRREGQSAALPQRAALQALDLGRPRRAGRCRLRRHLQPRAAGKLRRLAEARCRQDGTRTSAFGPRLIGYNLRMNFSANGWGDPDARSQASAS